MRAWTSSRPPGRRTCGGSALATAAASGQWSAEDILTAAAIGGVTGGLGGWLGGPSATAAGGAAGAAGTAGTTAAQ